jgi:hypothetical protein
MKSFVHGFAIFATVSWWLIGCQSQADRPSTPVVPANSLWAVIDSSRLTADLSEFFHSRQDKYHFVEIYSAETVFDSHEGSIRTVQVHGVVSEPEGAKRFFAFVRDTSDRLEKFYDTGFLQEECGTPGLSVNNCVLVKLHDASLVLLDVVYRTMACGASPSKDSVITHVFDVSRDTPQEVLAFEAQCSCAEDDEGGIQGTPWVRNTSYITGAGAGSNEVNQLITISTDSRRNVTPTIRRYEWDKASSKFLTR